MVHNTLGSLYYVPNVVPINVPKLPNVVSLGSLMSCTYVNVAGTLCTTDIICDTNHVKCIK